MKAIFWLILFIILLIIEICTLGLTTVWFAIGALVAWILALLQVSLPVQVIVFLVVSILLFILTRPIAIKYFNRSREKTNADGLIGQVAIVTETIDAIQSTGVVVINGMEWSAKASDGQVIEEGAQVLVESIQGVKLIVKNKEM